MADQFGLTTNGEVVVQRETAQTSGPQTRLTGGQSASPTSQANVAYAPGGNFQDVVQDSRKTLDALNKLTQGLLKPYIEQEQQKAYVDGMVAVAQGKSIVDVQKEQPWFTEIFGPSATVRGAQAMTTMGALDQAKTKFLTDMGDLRSQSPDAVRQYLVQNLSKIGTTGDPMTDAMVQQKLAEQMPALMDVHMREHLKYIQEANSNAYQNSTLAAGTALQQMVTNADPSMPQQLKDNEARYMADAWAPIPGQNPESWKKDVVTVARANLQQGNFAAIEVLKGSEHWKALDWEAKQQIDAMIPIARENAKQNLPTLRTDVFNANIMENQLSLGYGPQSMEDLQRWMDAKDAEFKAKNGTSTPYFNNSQRSRMEDLWFQGQKARAASQAKLNSEANDLVAQETAFRQGVNTMTIPAANDKISNEVKASVMGSLFGNINWTENSEGNQNQLDKFAVASATFGSDALVPQVKGRWTAAVTQLFRDGANLSNETQASMQQWRMLLDPRTSNGRAALTSYVGAENAAKVEAMLAMSPDLSDPAKLNAARKAIAAGYAEVPHAADREAAVGVIDKETPGIIGRIFGSAGQLGGINLTDGAKYKLSRDLADSVARFRRIGLSDDAAAQQAFDLRYGGVNGADFVSGVIVDRGSAPSTLAAKLTTRNGGSQGQADYQTALTNTWQNIIKSQVAAQGAPNFDPTRLAPIFGTNLAIGGKVAIQMQVQDKKTNRMYTVTFNEDQVAKEFDALASARAQKRANPKPALGQQPQSTVVETGFGPTLVR